MLHTILNHISSHFLRPLTDPGIYSLAGCSLTLGNPLFSTSSGFQEQTFANVHSFLCASGHSILDPHACEASTISKLPHWRHHICMCMGIYVYTYIYIQFSNVFIYAYMCLCVYVHIYLYFHMCMPIMCIFVSLFIYLSMYYLYYTYACVCMCVCLYCLLTPFIVQCCEPLWLNKLSGSHHWKKTD